jgi:hypothetical protein
MKLRTFVFLLLVGILGIAAGDVRAQSNSGSQQAAPSAQDNKQVTDQDIALLRKDLRSSKKQLVASNLNLTADQATKFWPVYDQYTADLIKINDEKYAIIKEYANSYGKITDEQAVTLLNRALSVDEQVTQLRIKYVPIFLKVLPGTLTASFFQIDRRVQAMIDLQIMAQLPLVQSQQQ